MKADEENPLAKCRTPMFESELIKLAHGSGGKMAASLIDKIFLPHLTNDVLAQLDDAADVTIGDQRIAISTDSYVVSPIFFPGGNIGSLAVHGTINDLCMRAAKAQFLTATFIMEEGLAIDDLKTIISSFSEACSENAVKVVAADTKVVGRAAADKVFITTTGIGTIDCHPAPSCQKAREGDLIIVSGDIGLHGMAVMSAREGLQLETEILSDSCSLQEIVFSVLQTGRIPHCMRDITRGGLATVLNEICKSSNVGMLIDESKVPINSQVSAVCELLGLDPLYVACEGRFVAIVDPSDFDIIMEKMRSHQLGIDASVIGHVVNTNPGRVILRSCVGGKRIVDMLAGDQLPRIC